MTSNPTSAPTHQPPDLSNSEALIQSNKKAKALEQKARDLARSVETVRQQTLAQSNKKIEALEKKARDLARFVETTRKEVLSQSDQKIEALEQKARDLADFVETLRHKTRAQSEKEIEVLGKKAGDLAYSVETVRKETRKHFESEVAAMGKKARDLAASVEAVGAMTLLQWDSEITTLGQSNEKTVAMNEALLLGSLRQHELTEAAEKLNEQLRVEIAERKLAEQRLRFSEIRHRRLFEAAQGGILTLDPETRKITDANPYILNLLGYTMEQIVGKELWEIGLLSDKEASLKAFRVLKSKGIIRYESLPLKTWAGQRREVEFVSNLYEENGGSVIQCNIRDITDRKHSEDALRQSEERYRTLFNSIDEGFCVIEMLFDKDGKPDDYRFSEVNPSFEKQSGMHEVLGKRMREIVPDLEANWFETYGNVALTGKPVRFVNEAKALNKWFDVYAFRLGDEESRKIAVLFTDISERRLNDDALLAAKEEIVRHSLELERVVENRTSQLRETVGELEAFSYSVSHDMRAPLRAMQSFGQILVDEYGSKLDEQGINYLHQIMRSSVRLDRLIQDVLSYSRILHTKLPMESVNLDRLMRDMVASFPTEQPIKPEIQIKGRLPKVIGNEALLAQCISNLLSNAAKFISPGTTPHVEISAEPAKGGSIRVWFKDNGIGIAPENHTRIFRLFERIHPASQYEGTGIGLTIVRKAIDRMGAQVGFESTLGSGSNFWIQLKKA